MGKRKDNVENYFSIIEMVNKDLGENFFLAFVPDTDLNVGIGITDPLWRPGYKHLGYKYRTFSDLDSINEIKKYILSTVSVGIDIIKNKPYEEILNITKTYIKKRRNCDKILKDLGNQYGVCFGSYPCSSKYFDVTNNNFVIFPKVACKNMDMFKFCKYYTLRFDTNGNVIEKSLNSYRRKMDKVIVRIKCLTAAFDNTEMRINNGDFYKFCDIKKSGFGDWIIKFPYTINKKTNGVWISGYKKDDVNVVTKLMDMFRYKDFDFCIWRASTPEEFEMMRELLK